MFAVPKNLRGSQAVPYLRENNPNIFLVTVRSLNGNVVVYEVVVKNKKITGIEFYWLNLEPSYRASKSLREECNFLEKKVFGYQIIQQYPRKLKIVFNKLKHVEVNIILTNKGKVNCFLQASGRKINIAYIFVKCRTILTVPTVSYIDIRGYCGGTKVSHRIKNQ